MISTSTGNDSISGGDGNDYVSVTGGNNVIDGGAGNDTIYGGSGSDSIVGGAGNDVIYGSQGKNVYYYANGDGADIINNFNSDNDVIKITNGEITANTVKGKDLILTVGKGSITLKDMASKEITVEDENGRIKTYWGATKLDGDSLYGSVGNDSIDGNSKYTTYALGAGNDTVSVISGNNTIFGEAGNDRLFSTSTGNDSISGGDGNDYVSVTGGNNVIDGGAGNDTIYGGDGNDSIEGGAGNDLIHVGGDANSVNSVTGGLGNDNIHASSGKDEFYYKDGDGADIIYDFDNAKDIIRLVEGEIKSSAVRSKDLVLTIGKGSITLKGMAGQEVSVIGADGTKKYLDATELNGATLKGSAGNDNISNKSAYTTYYLGAGNDILSVDQNSNAIFGEAGNDRLFSTSDGNDSISGGDGNDYVSVTGGNNVIDGGAGNDTIYGGDGNDSIEGGAGNDLIHVDGEANSVNSVIGGLGNDNIYASSGKDEFYYKDGDGADIIYDFDNTKDVIKLIEGDITANMVRGKDVVLTVGRGSITLKDMASQEVSVIGADGETRTYLGATKLVGDSLYGSVGNDSVVGDAKYTTYALDKGNDTLSVYFGNSTIYGEAGNDRLLSFSDGNDSINGGDGNDYISVVGGNNFIDAEAGNDTIYGGAANDTIYGAAGNDTIYLAGDASVTNRVNGGLGNDNIYASDGTDMFYYNTVDGADKIYDFDSSKDIIMLIDGEVGASGVRGKDLILTVGKTTVTVVGKYNEGVRVKGLDGKIRTYLGATTLVDDSLYGSVGNDSVVGEAQYTTYALDRGNDTLSVYSENNIIYGEAGNDRILSFSNGNDSIDGGEGNDYISVVGGNNVIYGRGGNDTIYGGEGNDSIYGGIGNDVIYSQGSTATVNYIYGDAGNDVIYGSDTAKDVFCYMNGDGNDVINNYVSGQDEIRITNGEIKSRTVRGEDVVFTVGYGSITVKKAKNADITIKDSDGNLLYNRSNTLVSQNALAWYNDNASDANYLTPATNAANAVLKSDLTQVECALVGVNDNLVTNSEQEKQKSLVISMQQQNNYATLL